MRLCSTISDNVEGSGPTSLKSIALGFGTEKVGFLEAGYKNNKLTECNLVKRYVAQEDLLNVFGNMIITQAVLKFPFLHGTRRFTAFS
jgi:hypothetical protein